MSFIYIASPYSDPSPWVRAQRYEEVARYTARLIKDGKVVYSPIVHNHPLAVRYDLPKDFDFWKVYDLVFVSIAAEVHVLRLEGWEKSKGVLGEIAHAESLNIPIEFVDP